MATDPTDFCPNEQCGGARDACGCPSDLTTQSLMVCLVCGGRWWRPYDSDSFRCPHPGCGQDMSLITIPAARRPERGEDGQPLDTDDGPDGDECHAEFIDGSWTYCGCPECDEREENDKIGRAHV